MFDSATLASIASSVRAGQYNLLLGAGVSLDSRNAQGFLPSAETFRKDLCTLKGARPSSTLQRVFSTLNDHEVTTVVVPRFINCVPGPSVKKIPQFLWRRIFTFNIDDALEAAYTADQTYQTSQVFHFEDTYTEVPESSEVPIVHLHGWVFDYDQIVRNFLGDLSGAFYEEIRELWQWNSRYWDQVALLNLSRYYAAPLTDEGRDALVQAVQHARHAVSIEVHPFSLTTLGTILLAQIGPEEANLTDIYNEAFERLSDAIDRERNWAHRNPHSFNALFVGTNRYVDSGGKLTGPQRNRLERDSMEAQKLFPRDQEITAAVAQLKSSLRI